MTDDLNLPHEYIQKPCPKIKWSTKPPHSAEKPFTFNWCSNCKEFAWALPVFCYSVKSTDEVTTEIKTQEEAGA